MKHSWWERFKASSAHTQANIVCTALIMVATIAYTAIAALQLGAIKGQLGQMKGASLQTNQMLCLYQQQLAELQRQSTDTHGFAIASIEQAIAITQSQSARFSLTQGKAVVVENQPIGVPVQIVNIGPTAARNVHMEFVALLMNRSDNPQFYYSLKHDSKIAGSIWDAGIPLSNMGVQGKQLMVDVHQADGTRLIADRIMAADFTEGRKDVVLFGELTYEDVFGVRHWKHVCSVSANLADGTTHSEHGKCTDYNQEGANRLIATPVEPERQPASATHPCPKP